MERGRWFPHVTFPRIPPPALLFCGNRFRPTMPASATSAVVRFPKNGTKPPPTPPSRPLTGWPIISTNWPTPRPTRRIAWPRPSSLAAGLPHVRSDDRSRSKRSSYSSAHALPRASRRPTRSRRSSCSRSSRPVFFTRTLAKRMTTRSPPGSRLACGTHCRTRRLAKRRTPDACAPPIRSGNRRCACFDTRAQRPSSAASCTIGLASITPRRSPRTRRCSPSSTSCSRRTFVLRSTCFWTKSFGRRPARIFAPYSARTISR